MDGLYNQTLHHLDKAFKRLEAMVPPPQKVSQADSFVFRYVQRTIQQAMILKLARNVSGLHAARILLDNGFLQEQGAVHRMLDEFHQDIMFLAFAVLRNNLTPLHQEYLDTFYLEEEFDGPFTEGRPMVPRRKIRAYLTRVEQELTGVDPGTGVELTRTIHRAMSGFVHGASIHIMEMYGGNPPRFHLHGMIGSPRQEEQRRDLYNPFFRAIISFGIVAKAFGDDELARSLHEYLLEFDRQSGRNEAFRGEGDR